MTTNPDLATKPALVFAPQGRDAEVARALLEKAGISSIVCKELRDLENGLNENTALAVVTEDILLSSDLDGIRIRLANQPPWSDLPFIILTQRTSTREQPRDTALYEVAGNVTLLERPFRAGTFISVARTAFKGRMRQFEARTRMEELAEGEERLRIALRAGRMGSWELELGTLSLTTSRFCKGLFGRDAEEAFTYDELIQSIYPDDRALMCDALQASVESAEDYAIECRIILPDSRLRCVEIRARLVRGRADEHPRLVGVLADITDRKASEDNLRQTNEMLEARVTARTAELKAAHAAVLEEIAQKEKAEEQLRQIQKMEMIGQLTGGVAHDFNNLLMAVLGNLELLRKRIPDDPKIMRLVSGAMQGAQRGAALTQRLLAFARRQDLKVEPRNIADLVRGIADLIERSAGNLVDVRLDLPPGLPLALVDANQIELAVLNLVVNARDAMPNGGILSITVDHLDVPATAPQPGGPYVRLVISDTGYGMDAKTLEKATEPFFSTKELGKGTGLGLSMVHGLALQLNGSFRLTSEIGQGTRAELLLPVTARTADGKPAIVVPPNDETIEKLKILVVDDDPLVVTSTVDMLEDLGHDVLEADSGDNALEIIRSTTSLDLLVTDYLMPRMNGAQLAEAARTLRPQLPVLLATGYAELAAGSDLDLPRIGKPYHQDQLAAEITKLLKRTPRGATFG